MSNILDCAVIGGFLGAKIETIVISKKEYETLVKDSKILTALYAGGVNNWEGYETSLENISD